MEVADNYIERFVHCGLCIDSIPNGMSPRDYTNNEIGIMNNGFIQVWCIRHEKNVAIFDVENGMIMTDPDQPLDDIEVCDCCNDDTEVSNGS